MGFLILPAINENIYPLIIWERELFIPVCPWFRIKNCPRDFKTNKETGETQMNRYGRPKLDSAKSKAEYE